MRSTLAACCLSLVFAAACKNDAPSTGFAAPTRAPEPAPAPTTPADPARTPAAPAPGMGPAEKIFAQMAKEKAGRTGARPTVEEVYAAIGKAGVTFAETKQVVALTAGASYCVTASNAAGLIVVVCEYSSPAEAAKWRDALTAKFKELAPNRTFTIKGATSIQVVDRDTAPLPDVRRRIDEALATL